MPATTATTHSTAPSERLDALCDQLLARLNLLPAGQTVSELADHAEATAGDTHAALVRLQSSGLAVPTRGKRWDAPMWRSTAAARGAA